MDTPVTTIETPARKAPPAPRNGVDTPKLFATIGAVASQPTLAQFRFRAQSHWVGGTQSRTTIAGFYGVGAEMQHDAPFQASRRSPEGTMRRGQCTRSGRMGAARACGVPHRGHREYLRGARRHPSFGGMQRRRRYRSARHPWSVGQGPQWLPGDPCQLHGQGRCARGEAATDRRSGPRPFGRLRHPDRACPGHDRGGCLSNLANIAGGRISSAARS